MKNIKSSRIIALSFLLLIAIAPPASNLFSTAQGQSTSSALEGTDWEVTVKDYYKVDAAIYRLGAQNKVEIYVAGTVVRDYRRNLNDQMDIVPRLVWERIPNGTFKQTGNSVRIEFSDHIIEATIKGNRMEGQARSKQDGRTANWAAEKISNFSQNTVTRSVSGKDLLVKADELMKQGKYLEAIENYSAALKLNLTEEEKLIAFGNRGNARVKLKDYKSAKADYKQFFDIYFPKPKDGTYDPTLAGFAPKPNISEEILISVWNGNGIVEYMIGDKDKACDYFNISCSKANSSSSGNKIGCENVKKFCKKN